jgi:hypothetical protein
MALVTGTVKTPQDVILKGWFNPWMDLPAGLGQDPDTSAIDWPRSQPQDPSLYDVATAILAPSIPPDSMVAASTQLPHPQVSTLYPCRWGGISCPWVQIALAAFWEGGGKAVPPGFCTSLQGVVDHVWER